MINVLVTGSEGQLGSELKNLVQNSEVRLENYNFFFTSINELDITRHLEVKCFIIENNIKIILNSAAYTNVDKAQEEKKLADNINHIATKNLANLAKVYGIKLIHISTDYVFDGTNFKPYVETDTPNPQSAYGKSKFDGERAIIESNLKNSIIIRTSWLYSQYGNNFVKTILKLGKKQESLGVIFDQTGTPTYAKDLAKTILEILPKIKNTNLEIYHYSNEGVASWFDFAKEIIKMSKLHCKITPIETKDYPVQAKRPHYSVLNKAKIKKSFNLEISYWKESLNDCLKKIGEIK